MSESPAVQSVPELDLERYLGLWYEIGRLPLKWEDEHASSVTANYSLQEDGNVQVDNRCFDDTGDATQSVGRARPVEGEPGQFKVSFLPQFLRWIPFTEGDYWVLKVAADYSVAIVGTPDRKNLWLLARQYQVSQQIMDQYLAVAIAQGFRLDEWIRPRQDGRVVSDEMLIEDAANRDDS